MKNLFYVCLVAMLSLGSTGFTTVEEMESQDFYSCEEACGVAGAQVFHDARDAGASLLDAVNDANEFIAACEVQCDMNEFVTPAIIMM